MIETLIIFIFVIYFIRKYFFKKPKIDFKGKYVLITGASGGLGTEMAHILADKGANLILWDLCEESLTKLYHELSELYKNIKIIFTVIDITDNDKVNITIDNTKRELGQSYIYCVINNAGIWSQTNFLDMTYDRFIKTFNVNLFAPMNICRQVLPDMIKQDSGMIVDIASIASFFNKSKCGTDYFSSKAALHSFHNALTAEIPSSIHTLCVYPFVLDSPLFKDTFQDNSISRLLVNYVVPPIKCKVAAQKIVDSMEDREHRLFLPCWLIRLILLVDMLPGDLGYFIYKWVNSSSFLVPTEHK